MMKKGIRFILAAALAAALPLTAHATSESLSGSALEGTADSASDGASDSTSSDYSSLWADRMTDGDSGSTLDDGSDSGLYDWTSGFDSSSMTAEEARQLVRLAEASQDSLKFETTTDVQTSFNEENNFYVYTFPNQNQIETSVPNGAMTSGPVILHISKDSTDVTATKDNETYSIGDGYYFSEPGTYELELLCGPGNYSGDNLTFYQYRFSFQIMKDGFSRQNFLVAPEGYEIVHAYKLRWSAHEDQESNLHELKKRWQLSGPFFRRGASGLPSFFSERYPGTNLNLLPGYHQIRIEASGVF